MLGGISFSAAVMNVKARRPEKARPIRMSQSVREIFTIFEESMLQSESAWEERRIIKSPEIEDQLTRTDVETP